MWFGDETHATDEEIGMILFDAFGERNLGGGGKKQNEECLLSYIQRTIKKKPHLVSRPNRDLLLLPVSATTHIDKINTKFLQLANKDGRLLNSPRFPFPIDLIYAVSTSYFLIRRGLMKWDKRGQDKTLDRTVVRFI